MFSRKIFLNSLNEKLFVEPLTDKKVLSEPRFYKRFLEKQNVTKYSNVFKNHIHSHSFTVSNSQDLASQLNITEPCVKNLLKDLLVEMRSFKYQITLQVSFRKEIEMMKQSIHHQFISILILKQ